MDRENDECVSVVGGTAAKWSYDVTGEASRIHNKEKVIRFRGIVGSEHNCTDIPILNTF